MRLSQPLRILLALVIGLAAGILAGPAAPRLVVVAEPTGKAWLAALQMPLIPLVFGLLVTGVATAQRSAQGGTVAARAIALFAVLLLASATVAALLASAILAVQPPPTGLAAAIGVPASPPEVRSTADWLLSFIPANPIAAAANGEMVAIVLFALLFGFAATRIELDARQRLIGVIEAMVEALLVVIGWVLALAPVGVAALGFVAGSRAGGAAAGALIHYVLLVVLVCASVTALLYPLAGIAGRIGLLRFARAALPAQLIAFSTQSSLASLPAMIAAADRGLGIRREVRSMVLPMAVSLFRITSPAANLSVALYVAASHGITLGPVQLAIGVAVAALVSLAAVGLPSQVSFFTTISPVCLAMGVPVDLLPLLLAVETVPDIFRTIGNVTADLSAARIIDRSVQ